MRQSFILATLLVLMALTGCVNNEVNVYSTSVQGPLSPYLSVVNKSYQIDENIINVEFERIGDAAAPTVTNPKLIVEFLDINGGSLGKSESDFRGTSEENVGALLRLNPGDKCTVGFQFTGSSASKIAIIRVSSDGLIITPAPTPSIEERKAPKPAQSAPKPPAPKARRSLTGALSMSGMIGGYHGNLTLSNGSGRVTLTGNGTRQVSISSYEPASRRLILNSYLNGKYIGQYKGTFDGSSYRGVFHNIISGGKVDFNLSVR